MRLKLLLGGILAFHAGWYMLVPFFAILFTTRRGMTPAEVGLVLAAQSFMLLLGSLAGGALADRYGRRLTMTAGLILRSAGVALLGLAYTVPGALAAAAVAGVGGGLYSPAAKAAIAVLATREHHRTCDRTCVFSWRGIAANIGTSSGPLLGSLLVRGPMPVLFGISGAVHAGMGLLTWFLLPPDQEEAGARARAPWREMFADRPFLAFSAVTTLSWALFSQLALAVPLYASRVLGLEASIGLLWTASSLAVIALQVPVTRFISGRLPTMTTMAAGAALLGAGLGLVGPARSFAGLLGAVLIFVAGEMLLMPMVDTAISTMAPADAVGSYFGMASFAWGLGEGIGNLAGGGLMQFALGRGRLALPFIVYAATGLGVGLLFVALGPWIAARRRLPPPRPLIYRPGQPVPDEDALLLGGFSSDADDQ